METEIDLLKLRWPTGFKCPACDSKGKLTFTKFSEFKRCSNKNCRKLISPISHTRLHKTKISLNTWVDAFENLLSPKTVSAKQFGIKKNGLKSSRSIVSFFNKILESVVQLNAQNKLQASQTTYIEILVIKKGLMFIVSHQEQKTRKIFKISFLSNNQVEHFRDFPSVYISNETLAYLKIIRRSNYLILGSKTEQLKKCEKNLSKIKNIERTKESLATFTELAEKLEFVLNYSSIPIEKRRKIFIKHLLEVPSQAHDY
jgi:hypothetical protein